VSVRTRTEAANSHALMGMRFAHQRRYGCSGANGSNCSGSPVFKFEDFLPMFKAELFDPDEWAALFKTAGAKYVPYRQARLHSASGRVLISIVRARIWLLRANHSFQLELAWSLPSSLPPHIAITAAATTTTTTTTTTQHQPYHQLHHQPYHHHHHTYTTTTTTTTPPPSSSPLASASASHELATN
jgi:hypothetical protein